MRLMKFAPEIVRLRRVAKAYAAGEFSQLEYRDTRREVIENFQPDHFVHDDTRRRARVSERQAPEYRGDMSATLPATEPRWLGRLWLAGLLVAALIIANFAFAARIVPVSERDPNPATSPRFRVSEIRLADFRPYPGIERESVEALIEETLDSVRRRDVVGEHGFTQAELGEVGRFLKAVGVHSDGVELTSEDVRDLVGMIQVQRERRGVSLVQLEEIAAEVQVLYRNRGYFLAVAFVPSQQVDDGVVVIRVLPGTLGSIVVSGGDSTFLTRRFADVLGQPVTHQLVDERIYEINQLPGFKAQASLEPGGEVGETRLNLDVIEQRTWSTRVWVDNHGDQATGDERFTLAGSWLNPRGAGDVLNLGFMASVNPGNQTYGYVEYATPLNGGDQIRARIANNDFVSERAVELDGDAVMADVTMTRALRRTRSRSLMAGLSIKHHKLSWEDGPRQQVTFFDGLVSGHRVWDAQRIAADARLAATVGRIGGDNFAGQDEKFWRLSFDALAWTPISLPILAGEQKLAVKLIGQVTDSQLPASLRLNLGGAWHTRGFSR
ncbi:MAG: hypothetical protein O7E57_07600, partial [Gammaproteobacteria bacterium]|nr:hypothetical protein [Gammaproteobacteria bacterium]